MKRNFTLTACIAVALMAAASAFAGTVDPHHAFALAASLGDPGSLFLGLGTVAGAGIRALQQRKAGDIGAMRALQDKATTEGRDLTEAEQTDFDAHAASVQRLNAQIERETMLSAEEAGLNAVSVAVAGATAGVHAVPGGVNLPARAALSVSENIDLDTKRGFRGFGDFSQSVKGATVIARTGHGALDKRLASVAGSGGILAAAPASFAGEGNGGDGGFLIPPDFAREIFQLSLGEDSLLPSTDNTVVASNSMVFPKDETTPWGTNGVRAYWQGEATAATATKPVFGSETLRLKKLMALVPVSDEMLSDTTALGSFLPKKVGLSIRWKANEAILWGTGGPQPQGALNSGALLVVAKETGQSTLTLQPMNLAKMIAALPPGSYPNAVWIMNNDVLPYLFTLNSNNQVYYLPYAGPQGAFQGNPYGLLLGRPIVISQHAKSFTNQGDISLLDLSYYQAITKGDGVQTDVSMHLYFDADAMAFRTTFRVDGMSKLSAAISPANGTNKLSPFVTLGAR